MPVAVVRDPLPLPAAELCKIVSDALGSDHALEDAFALSDLGRKDFPLNATGKVEKVVLTREVLALLERRRGS